MKKFAALFLAMILVLGCCAVLAEEDPLRVSWW